MSSATVPLTDIGLAMSNASRIGADDGKKAIHLMEKGEPMGQHNHNPNCQLAREGKLPPKPKKMSKRQRDRMLMAMIYERTGIGAIERAVGINSFKEAEEMADLLRR